jgi:regulator of replication initiation timing
MTNVTIDDLMKIIGRLHVENELLRQENQALKAALAEAAKAKKPKDPPAEAA